MRRRVGVGAGRFADVNYQIAPFTRRIRSFFAAINFFHQCPSSFPPFHLSALWNQLYGEDVEQNGDYMYVSDARRQRSPEPWLNSVTGRSQRYRDAGLSRPPSRQAWTRTRFITCLFVPYIPLTTPLLLRDEIRARDTVTKETRTRVARMQVFSALPLLHPSFKCRLRIVTKYILLPYT